MPFRIGATVWTWTVMVALGIGAIEGASAQRTESPRVTIEYIAHASFMIESASGTRVLLDPYADQVWLGYDFPVGLRYDAVAITHPHYDHDGGEFRGMEVPWGPETPVFRDAGRYDVGDLRLIGVDAKHADPYGKEFGQKNVVWIIEAGDVTIAHLGDNGPLTPEVVQAMHDVGSVDILMLPVDGAEHILTFEAVHEVIEALAPRVVIPMHYRIPELEPADGPTDLGPVDPWLESRPAVRRLDANVWPVESLEGIERGTVVVFRPSSDVPRPR